MVGGWTGLSWAVLTWAVLTWAFWVWSQSMASGLVMLNMASVLMCPQMPQLGWLVQLRMAGISPRGPVPQLAWASSQHNRLRLVGLLLISQLAQKTCSRGLKDAVRLPVT